MLYAIRMGRKRRLPDLAAALLLFAGNLVIIAPFLRTALFSDIWNNDYNYIGDARMFRDQPWGWNMLQYGGTPAKYIYPPLFHLLALLVPVHSLGLAIHIVSGLAYASVPAALYVLALVLFRSRLDALATAAIYSIFPSPVYAVLPVWRNLAQPFRLAPWQFVDLIAYREAPHMLATALTLIAVAAFWRGRMKIAIGCAAAVFLLSWPGIVALLIAFAAVAIARRAFAGAFAAIGIAYGLVAFWMTPGFFAVTSLLNRVISRHELPHAPWNAITWTIVVAAFGLLALSLWRRVPPSAALLLGWLALFGAPVAAYSLLGNYLLPLPHRYVSEFNIGLVLAIGALIAKVAKSGRWGAPVAIALLAGGGFAARDFLGHVWELQPAAATGHELPFHLADWLQRNAGRSRIFSAGELEGSLNAMTDVAQVGGNAQGISNFLIAAVKRELTFGCEGPPDRAAKLAELWLRALDVQYVVVHDAASREYFHWFVQPERFASLPVAWTNGAGDTIYRVPHPEQHQAVVVDLAALEHLPPLRSTNDLDFLEAYTAWAQGKRPVQITWSSRGVASIDADLTPDEGVLVKENYDRGWHSGAGRVESDPIGFLLIRGAQNHRQISLRFGASWDVWLARLITILTIVLLLARVPAKWIALLAVAPAALSYGFLLESVPPQTRIAEQAFRRLQPPLINPGGIVNSLDAKAPIARGKLVSIYGLNFGSARDRVRVSIGDRSATVAFHGPEMINAMIPQDAPASASISVEVNGCRGNAFTVPLK